MVGRYGRAIDLIRFYREVCELDKTRLISVEPFVEWYPAPKNPDNQEEAICGLKTSVPKFDSFVSKIEEKYSIDRSTIVLSGFSAGAVMAIQVAANSQKPFAAVISHNGAILDPETLQESNHNIPFFLIHSKNDQCFSWEERYIPMKKALLNKKYTVKVHEKEYGDHAIEPEDIAEAAIFLAKILGYNPEWTHSFKSL